MSSEEISNLGNESRTFAPSAAFAAQANAKPSLYTEANSDYVKKSKLDKVLLAKKFLESYKDKKSISLNNVTTDNITKLFDNIESKF